MGGVKRGDSAVYSSEGEVPRKEAIDSFGGVRGISRCDVERRRRAQRNEIANLSRVMPRAASGSHNSTARFAPIREISLSRSLFLSALPPSLLLSMYGDRYPPGSRGGRIYIRRPWRFRDRPITAPPIPPEIQIAIPPFRWRW